jgi:SSS family solute:Na+ symporter
MVLSAVLTVGVSLLTAPTAESDASRFAVAGD